MISDLDKKEKQEKEKEETWEKLAFVCGKTALLSAPLSGLYFGGRRGRQRGEAGAGAGAGAEVLQGTPSRAPGQPAVLRGPSWSTACGPKACGGQQAAGAREGLHIGPVQTASADCHYSQRQPGCAGGYLQ